MDAEKKGPSYRRGASQKAEISQNTRVSQGREGARGARTSTGRGGSHRGEVPQGARTPLGRGDTQRSETLCGARESQKSEPSRRREDFRESEPSRRREDFRESEPSRRREDFRESEPSRRREDTRESEFSKRRSPSQGRQASRGGRPARRRGAARRRREKSRAILICFTVIFLLGVGGWLYINGLAYGTVRVEAGIQVAASDFMKKTDDTAVFTEDSKPFDISVPGEYTVKVKSGWFVHRCKLIIEDTIAPQARAVPVQRKLGEACGAGVFVEEIEDATKVEVSYRTEPDFDKAGTQKVEIVLTDRGGNQTVLETELFLVEIAESVTIEAGGEFPSLGSFVVVGRNADFVTDVNGIDRTKVGEHTIVLEVDEGIYASTLKIEDTVPPRMEVQNVEGYALVPRKAEDFVAQLEDVTDVAFSFRQEPDLTLIGSQEVEIVATDSGGNETAKTAVLTLWEDTQPPEIQGAVNLTYFIGESISYRKNVKVVDNCQEGTSLEVDTSGADLNTEGVYPIVYNAKDAAGNTASVTVNLTVRTRMYSLEEMNAYADAVIAEIITPDMSLRDKAWAIYSYVVSHVAYITHSEKGDWIRAAYEGLAEGKGDCYVYACTTKALLTRAGVPNLDIERIPTRLEHYWNLVDVGEGWYHLDTTPRPDHPTIFLWTDEEMMAYSAWHYNAYNYDRSLYPEIN